MPTFYTHASIPVPLSKEQAQFAQKVWKCLSDPRMSFDRVQPVGRGKLYGEEVYQVSRKFLELYDPRSLDQPGGVIMLFEVFVLNEGGLVVHHGSTIDVAQAIDFIQALLQHFDLHDFVIVEATSGCSNSVAGKYRGYAAIVTQDEVKSFSTGEWLEKEIANRNKSSLAVA